MLEFLQEQLSAGLTPSTLKVYVAAIDAHHNPLEGQSLRRNPLVTHFLHGTLTRTRILAWDLAVVLEGLCGAPFEPLEEVHGKFLTLETVFLLAISSLKRVGDLHAMSVAPSCLEFLPGMANTFLYTMSD